MPNVAIEKKNILVTGGAGFIGSHLCDALIKEGNRVICIDNFLTSHPRNISALLQNPNFQFIRLDVNETFNLESFTELSDFKLQFQGIQEIYHLACPTAIKQFDQYKIQTLLANSLGNKNVLDIALKYKSKILLASSSVVYGDRTKEIDYFEESYEGIVKHLSPRACYDEGKQFSETMFDTYKQVHGLDTKIARIFRTYGPRMPLFDGHLIPDFILNALDGNDLEIYGGDDFKSSLVYVMDVVDGLIRLMNSSPEVELVNIGSDEDLKLIDVANKIIEMTGSSSKVVLKEQLPFLTEIGLPRITKARELGWLPLVRIEEGLKQTIDYIEANKILLTNI